MGKARFSLHFCRALLRRAGSQMVAKEASEELSKSLEKIAFEIAKIAVLCADDHGRMKVTDEDVRSALREYFD